MKLYEIHSGLDDLMKEAFSFDENTEIEVVDDWQARFMESKGNEADKLEAMAIVRQMAIGNAKQIEDEITRLLKMVGKEQKTAERMKKIISDYLSSNKKTEFKTLRFDFKFRKTPPRLELIEPLEKSLNSEVGLDIASDNLREIKAELSEKKKDIKDRLKNGEEIEGATLSFSNNLVIK